MADKPVSPDAPTLRPEPPNKAEFVDNRELTMAQALCAHLDWLYHTYSNPTSVDIATGYFNPEGFAMLADRLDLVQGIRLLLGAEPSSPPAKPVRMPGDPSGSRFERKLLNEALSKQNEGLASDRNLLEFAAPVEKAVKRLLDFIATGKLEVRRYEKGFMHGKAFIFATHDEGVIAGSSNFTAAGLTRNLELNLGRYDPTPVAKVKHWFDDLWAEAVPYDLASVYSARYEAYPPYVIFLKVLWERYKDDMDEERRTDVQRIMLTTFQNDGIARASRILEQYNGVLIADGVGLGKTFVGGEILRRVIEENRQRAILIAPAALRDGTWERFRDRFQLHFEVLSYEELAADVQVGLGPNPHLKHDPKDYSLVMVDEAQAFRNPDTHRARALRKLLQGKPPKKLVLMSATPVNNSLWDLYYLLTYFAKQDAAFADIGIRSLKGRFTDAMRIDPDDLTPDVLFDILDATTVRRTRHFVQRYYPNDRVMGPDGTMIAIRFPDPHVEAVTYSLDEVLPGFFFEFEAALAPPTGLPLLTLARYETSEYLKGEVGPNMSEAALTGLIRSGLLKRFESSAHAFRRTVERMAAACEVFLRGLEQGIVLTSEGIEEWQQTDNDELLDRLFATGTALPADVFEVDRLADDVRSDRQILLGFASRASQITESNDPKLEALKIQLLKILSAAERDGLDETDKRNKRKVLLFSFYADSALWIRDYLEGLFESDLRFAAYRGRMACVVGDEGVGGISRTSAVFGFTPVSTEAPAGRQDDLYDVLVTTDVLSEGMNLQQCRNIVNYDLPWNPMRLVQRHGRVDRIGSPHRDVYLYCFFPDDHLDSLLLLEEKIRSKISQTAASIGVEGEVIPGAATSEVVFADERAEIERLRREDTSLFVNAGEDTSAHSGEEYRQELRKGLEKYGDLIEKLPWGSGSSLQGGKMAGHFFCAYVGDRLFMRFMPTGGGAIVRDTLGCLRLIHCPDGAPVAAQGVNTEAAYPAWQKARQDIFDEWQRGTDPANLQPKIRPALRAAAEHLRNNPLPGMTLEELNRMIESIEAPWGIRIEKQIREARETAEGAQASLAIVETVKRLGLEPFKSPDPLPPIESADVRLVCWMQVHV
jgi:hypothetical protein